MLQTATNSPPQALASFQKEFANHMRDPHHVTRPQGISRRVAQVYQELLYNNLCEFLDACFPICQKMISDLRWKRLCRVFFRDWHMYSPIFTDIPKQFVAFLENEDHSQPLPAWFIELAHYEWIELAVEIDGNKVLKSQKPNDSNDFLANQESIAKLLEALENEYIKVNPTLRNQYYRWPVHKLSPEFKTRKREDTYILVFRALTHDVRFMHINAMTAALIELLANGMSNTDSDESDSFFERLAKTVNYPDVNQLASFGLPLLADLLQKQALYMDLAEP